MNKLPNRFVAYTALAMLASALAAPMPAFSQIVESDLRRMSVEQLRDQLQQFQSGQHALSTQDARREMRKIQRELQRRAASREQIQQQAQPQPQPQQPPAENGNVNREARQYLRSTGNIAQLNDRQLIDAIRTGRSLLQQPDLRGNLQNQVQQTVQAAEAERQRRQAAAQQPKPPADEGNVNREARQYLRSTGNVAQLNDRQLVDAIRTGRSLLQQPDLRGGLQNQVRETVQAAVAERERRQNANQQPPRPPADEGNVNREARQYLRSSGNVAQLNDRQLVDAIRTGRSLLQQPDLRGGLQNQVRETVQAAVAERERRQNASQQPPAGGNADAAARRLLSDNRPASALRDNQLRDRLQEARRVMGDSSLDRRLFRQVRRLAASDADELRNRVSQRQEDRGERREDRQDAHELLNDPRPAARLNDRQLQVRITTARDLLAAGNLRPGQQARIQDMLAEARQEKRRRLIAERQRRRDDLARQRRQNQIIIQIPRGVFEYRDDITAAEADDELLERQLIAPPTRRIDRRYSRSELQRARGWRDYMPAIEVDTIRFGFNESFVREEEIPQLERIGEIIERIVASNPDEVFLIEGHTDAVGSNSYNQSLSEKRADAVREAMLQYFNIAPENIETIGYGEDFLKIETGEAEQENRRVTIRRITPLLTGSR